MVPLPLLAHELAHGLGAFLADGECSEFAIQQTEKGARCTTRVPPVALEDQFSEVAAGPLLDLMLEGKLSPAASVEQAGAALNVWMRGLQESKTRLAMDGDASRAFRFGRCLDGAVAYAALQCALTAAVLAHGAYTQHGAHLWLVAARLATLPPEKALTLQANDIVNLLEHQRPLPLREVVLSEWLTGSEERANEAMAIEAELIAAQLGRRISRKSKYVLIKLGGVAHSTFNRSRSGSPFDSRGNLLCKSLIASPKRSRRPLSQKLLKFKP